MAAETVRFRYLRDPKSMSPGLKASINETSMVVGFSSQFFVAFLNKKERLVKHKLWYHMSRLEIQKTEREILFWNFITLVLVLNARYDVLPWLLIFLAVGAT